MLEITQTKNFTHNFCKFHVLNATDPCCIKRLPEDCGWSLDGYLKPTGFNGNPTPLQVDDTLGITNDDYNNANPSENDYNVETSDESDAE